MARRNFQFRKVVLWGIAVSLAFNMAVLISYFLLVDFFSPKALALTGFFLVVFLLVLQPLRDELLALLAEKLLFSKKLLTYQLEEKAAAIFSLEEAFRFLQDLVELWKLSGIRLVFYTDGGRIYFIGKKKAKRRSLPFRQKENEDLLSYLINYPQAQNVSKIPQVVRSYLHRRRIRAVAPVYFREEILGFLGFLDNLTETQLEIAEIIALRMGLLLKNEKLKSQTLRSALLSREFYLAQRIENYLLQRQFPAVPLYEIRRLPEHWDKKYFAAMMEIASYRSSISEWQNHYLLLCRLTTASVRMHTLQLFAVQGYFLSLAQSCPSVELLAEQLQLSLALLENEKINLDGFLLSFADSQLKLVHFGHGLSLRADKELFTPPDTAPLGTSSFTLNLITLNNPEYIELSIRGFPLVLCEKLRPLARDGQP